MADSFTTFSVLSDDSPNVAIAARVYEVSERRRVLGSFSRKERLPQRMSKTLRLIRHNRFDLPFGQLTEGVPPDAVALAIEHVDVTVAQYGIVGLITDVAQITVQHPALQIMEKRTGQAIGDVLERETAETLMGGGLVYYASTATTRALLTGALYLTTADILKATVALRALGATEMSDSLFGGVMSPQVEGDVVGSDTTFTNAAAYSKIQAVQYAEIGIWQGVRWKRGNFLPYFQSVAAPTASTQSATKAVVTGNDTGGAVLSGNHQFVVVARDKTTDYERRRSIQSASISTGGTGDNDSYTVLTPSSLNYVYDIYMSILNGTTCFLVASRQAGNTSVAVIAEPAGTEATPIAAVGDTAGDEVFVTWVFGEDAFFTVELNGMSTQSYITPAGPSWTNPLAQGRKVGTKVAWACGIIDSNWYARIESNSHYSAQLPA